MGPIAARRVVLVLLLAVATSAQAAPSVHVSTNAQVGISGSGGDTDLFEDFGTTSVSGSSSVDLAAPIVEGQSNWYVAGSSAAAVQLGIISASAQGLVQSTHVGFPVYLGTGDLAGGNAGVTADFTIDDLVVTPTEGGSATTVPLSLHLELAGSLGAGGSMNDPFPAWPAGAGGTATLHVSVQIASIGIVTQSGDRSFHDDTVYGESFSSSGLLAGGDAFSTAPVDVLVGAPFMIKVGMSLGAGASTNVTQGNGNAMGGFLGGLHVPFDGPVSDLPPGYTVDSPSAGIVDNEFVPVPEPGFAAAFAAGASLLAVLSRRRTR